MAYDEAEVPTRKEVEQRLTDLIQGQINRESIAACARPWILPDAPPVETQQSGMR
jgi:hypothetical protein